MSRPVTSSESDSNVIKLRQQVEAQVEQERQIYESEFNEKPLLSSQEILDALKANEDGDAALYILSHKNQFCFDHKIQAWFKWNGNFWQEDVVHDSLVGVEKLVDYYADEAANQAAIRSQAAKSQDESAVKKAETLEKELITRIRMLQTLNRKKNILVLASSGSNSLGISGDQWDSNPLVLPCANGVIELPTGSFRPGLPEEYIKTAAPVEWKGIDYPASVWNKTLYEIFEGNLELISYFKRLLGYSISGLSTEPIFVILYGEGRNGKGTITETIKLTLGPLVGPINSEMLLSQKHSRSSSAPSPDILNLQGKRIIWASESDEGRRLDISKMKWLTGNDTLIGRPVFGKREIEFDPTHTLFLMTNHKPHISADEYAAWQRVQLIPFHLSFVDYPVKKNERKRDKNLKQKLLEEAPGILAWLVKGFLEWQKMGLNPPDSVRQATEQYQEDEDLIGLFIKECCVLAPTAKIQSTPLYEAYKKWCDRNGIETISFTLFGTKMSKRFEKETKKYAIYKGITLVDWLDETIK